ncbi:hypothetical protein M569_14856 [Genlisea aurea]|uniref:Uncharacterized protein n=1 Tax=Genlisea aurea TaxID=192259 RepID=S8BZY1_9LAMI|nr:hypothetical protein M569_14856 [Genlisea aurea]
MCNVTLQASTAIRSHHRGLILGTCFDVFIDTRCDHGFPWGISMKFYSPTKLVVWPLEPRPRWLASVEHLWTVDSPTSLSMDIHSLGRIKENIRRQFVPA